MASRKPSKVLKPLTWRKPRKRSRSRSVAEALFYLDSSHRYRIEHLVGYSDLPFIAAVYDLTRNRRSHWLPIGRYATLADAKAACERHRQTPQSNGAARFTEAGDPLPRKFWE